RSLNQFWPALFIILATKSISSQDSTKYCIVEACKGGVASGWRKITDDILRKAEAKETLTSYYEKGLKKRRMSDNLSMSESIKLLANIIFQRDVLEKNRSIVDFSWFRAFAEKEDKRLTSFFNEIEAAADVDNKNKDERQELNRSLAYQSIDAFTNARITITSHYINRKKADMAELYDDLVDVETDAIPIHGSNGISIHNPTLIDFNIILKYLDEKYMKRIAFTSNEVFSYNILFDMRLEVLSLHLYDDRIKAQKEKRKMKDSMLFDFYKQELKTVGSKSKIIKTAKGENQFRLAGLNIVINKKQMPLGFSSDHIPARDECDYCDMFLNLATTNPIVLGIQQNISSLITRLTKQDDKDLMDDQAPKNRKKIQRYEN
ncbi:18623_t:CDS:2, partial [Racocetra persica]